MRTLIIALLGFFVSCTVLGQQIVAVTAQNGDGIFSLLRKQGLDPVKYYESFLNLNKENIKNGSELYLGRIYYVPDAEDSFKKKAVHVSENVETAIFEEELAQISGESERLSNAVIYLMLSKEAAAATLTQTKEYRADLVKELTKNLMVHGAQVYFIDHEPKTLAPEVNKKTVFSPDQPIADQYLLSIYVDEVNQRYLTHSGKYQRVLVIDIDETLDHFGKKQMTVYHHQRNLEGKAFAKCIVEVLASNGLTETKLQKPEVMLNRGNLYLATNILPPLSLVQVKNGIKNKKITKLNKEQFSDIIATAVLADYEDLNVGN